MSFKPYKPIPEGSTRAVIGHLYDQIGTAKQAAFLLGVPLSTAYNKSENATLTLDEAARLTLASGSPVVAEYFATLAGGAFVPEHSSDRSVASLISQGAKDHAEAVSALITGLEDGTLCPTDKARLCAELDAVIRAATQARRKLTSFVRVA